MRTPKKEPREAFLDAFGKTGNVSLACKAAKVGRRTVYQWRDADTEFARAWEDAREQSADLLEAEARRRAETGALKPIYQGGKLVGKVREFSDTLLIFLLKGNRPEKFRDRVEHTGKDGGPIRIAPDLSALTDEEIDTLERLLGKTTDRDPDAGGSASGAGAAAGDAAV